MLKLFKNKKGTAPFVEALILSPIVILIFVMLISNLFCYTKENSAEVIARSVIRSCIVCDSASEEDHGQAMSSTIRKYFQNRSELTTFREYYVHSISIEDLDTNNKISSGVNVSTDDNSLNNIWSKNRLGTEIDANALSNLNANWKKGNMLSITFYFSSFGFTKNFGELDDSGFALVPTGVYLTVYQIIEND